VKPAARDSACQSTTITEPRRSEQGAHDLRVDAPPGREGEGRVDHALHHLSPARACRVRLVRGGGGGVPSSYGS